MKNKELQVIEEEINPFLTKAQELIIKDGATMAEATEILSKLNLGRDQVIERMETITKPQKAAIKAAEAIWKPLINASKEAIEVIRDKMSEYQTEQTLVTRKEEDKIANRVKEGKGNLSLETATKKIAEIERPQDKVSTESGSLSFVEQEQFEVQDLAKLPLDYHLADEVKIRAAMKAGNKLPGVYYFIKMVPKNKR